MPSPCDAKALALITAVLYAATPLQIVEVPFDGFSQAGFEGFCRGPAEFALYFAGVDGVALIVAGAVVDEGDEISVVPLFARAQGVEDAAQGAYDVEIGLFVVAADVVGLTRLALCQDQAQGAGMVVDVEPVADVVAGAVEGQKLVVERVEDDQGDQFFRKLARAVVVRAVGGDHRQAVGVAPGAHEVVARCLARRVR